MKTELKKGEITKRSLSKYFKEILNYKFLSCNSYRYAIASGKYNIYFGDRSIYIDFSKKIITSVCVGYKDIEKIGVYIGEAGELYLQIDISSGLKVIFSENSAGIEFKDEVKKVLYEQ